MFDLAIPVGPTDHTIGPSHLRLTLVEYGDFECPDCKQAAPVVKLLLAHFHDRLRFAYRHFPLEQVHPHALDAALAAECAGGQERFWPMHDLLFERQPALSPDHLQLYAQRLELDMTRFSAEMSDTVYLQRIREHEESGVRSGVRATPTFFINGKLHDVSFGIAGLFEAVERAAYADDVRGAAPA